MYKSILAILLVGLLAAPLLATPPPAGWGNDPCEWDEYDGVCEPVSAIYRPDVGWFVCGHEEVDLCQTITVELWIELYASMTVFNLNHYFHAVGDERARDAMFEFVIEGYTSANNPLVICMKPGPDMDLNTLAFQENIFGNDDGSPDLDIYYEYIHGYVAGNGDEVPVIDWTRVVPDPNICFEVPSCDRWWKIRGYFFLYYHIADGYYLLYYAICPAPVL